MASRYTAEALLLLRQSPLCVKPPNLPPAEQWMGHPPDTARAQQTRPTAERAKTNDGTFTLDPTRRSVGDRHSGRSTSTGEDAIVGPSKVGFASMRSLGAKLGGDGEKPFRDQDSRGGFGFRTRSDQPDLTGYTSGGGFGSSSRETRNAGYRRRGDGDQDNEGWSTVKPRHSFGHEGAERFHGRMGGGGSNSNNQERFSRDDRKSTRDRDDGDYNGRDRPRRTFDRDSGRDGDDNAEGTRRNGLGGRGPWYKDSNGGANDERTDRQERPNFDRGERPSQRDRISQAKNWRERDPNNQPLESYRERNNTDNNGSGFDRRWDRDRDRDRGGDRDYYQQQRVERDPEWMDEDITFADDKPSSGGHTAEDLRRFIEEMKGLRPGGSAEKPADAPAPSNGVGVQEATAKTTIDTSRDRFFEQFSKPSKTEEADADAAKEAKAKAGKSSRFTSFFSTQEDSRRQFEPQMPAATNGSPQSPPNAGTGPAETPDAAEKVAFQALLQKLQRQTIGVGGDGTATSGPSPSAVGGFSIGGVNLGGPNPSNTNSHNNQTSVTPPNLNAFQGPQNAVGMSTPHGSQPKSTVVSPEPSRPQSQLQSGADESRFRSGMPPMPQQGIQEAFMQRQQPIRSGQSPQSSGPSARPEQMIQELLMQRQQATSQEGGAPRMGSTGAGPNPNTEFLMKLMQSHSGPDNRNLRPGQEDMFMRGAQAQKPADGPPLPDREAEIAEFAAAERERMALARQQVRLPAGPVGLFNEEQFHRPDIENRPPPQPTQILQRPPPPPGLEHNMHGPPPPPAFLQQQHFLQQQQQQLQPGAGGGGGRMQPQQAPPPGSQQPMIAPPGLGMHPGNQPNRTMPNIPGMPGMPPMPNMPPMHNMHMPPGMLNMPPNMSNMANMPPPMQNMPPMLSGMMFPPNFSPNGPFPPDGAPAGLPRNMHPPLPEFYNGPPGPNGPNGMNGPNGPSGPPPPGFMPPLGMGFQGPPMDGIPFPFSDGRGMPQQAPPPGFRRG